MQRPALFYAGLCSFQGTGGFFNGVAAAGNVVRLSLHFICSVALKLKLQQLSESRAFGYKFAIKNAHKSFKRQKFICLP